MTLDEAIAHLEALRKHTDGGRQVGTWGVSPFPGQQFQTCHRIIGFFTVHPDDRGGDDGE